jgi:uncharacterized phage-associated protein
MGNFKLDTRKTIEAAATLLRLAHEQSMGRKRLLALLYLADRESLKRTGRPIIGGRVVAMDYGPIHSEVYDFIKGGHREQPKWSGYFGNESYYVILRNDPGVFALSRYEIGVLNDISTKYMGYDDWDVADVTHKFDEYKSAYQEGTSTAISLEQLIDAVGRSAQKDAILQDAKEKAFLDHLFSGDK